MADLGSWGGILELCIRQLAVRKVDIGGQPVQRGHN
jgi:hypothetical protein